MIMKLIIIIIKKHCEKSKTNKIDRILSIFLPGREQRGKVGKQTDRNVKKSEESVRECAPFTSFSP